MTAVSRLHEGCVTGWQAFGGDQLPGAGGISTPGSKGFLSRSAVLSKASSALTCRMPACASMARARTTTGFGRAEERTAKAPAGPSRWAGLSTIRSRRAPLVQERRITACPTESPRRRGAEGRVHQGADVAAARYGQGLAAVAPCPRDATAPDKVQRRRHGGARDEGSGDFAGAKGVRQGRTFEGCGPQGRCRLTPPLPRVRQSVAAPWFIEEWSMVE
jgi:hypothetical protein